jgi:DNA polymerase
VTGQLGLFDQGPRDLLAIRDYEEFKRRLAASGCDRCDLSRDRRNIVVDRGHPGSRVMAVGEGPGADEDAQGRAFVGRGGQLFDRIMAEAGFDTNRDLLIANVVKCRPPENRVPHAAEVEACLPYLRHQIRLVKPKVIVLLGATALKHLLPARKNTPMREIVGKPFTDFGLPGVTFLVFYHPAFLLRDPRKLPEAREHIRTLARVLEERP